MIKEGPPDLGDNEKIITARDEFGDGPTSRPGKTGLREAELGAARERKNRAHDGKTEMMAAPDLSKDEEGMYVSMDRVAAILTGAETVVGVGTVKNTGNWEAFWAAYNGQTSSEDFPAELEKAVESLRRHLSQVEYHESLNDGYVPDALVPVVQQLLSDK